MSSNGFRELTTELSRLRRYFLPDQFDPFGNYTDSQIEHARAYVVLAHAAIESFLERRVREVAEQAVEDFKMTDRLTPPIVGLIAYSGSDMGIVSRPAESVQQVTTIKTKVCKALAEFVKTVNNNNGIKEKNILQLVCPIGLKPGDIDSVWLITMDSFGSMRGCAAHNSSSLFRVQHPLDPKSSFDVISGLVAANGLQQLDQLIDAVVQ